MFGRRKTTSVTLKTETIVFSEKPKKYIKLQDVKIQKTIIRVTLAVTTWPVLSSMRLEV